MRAAPAPAEALVQKQLPALEEKLGAKLPRTHEVVFEQVLKCAAPDCAPDLCGAGEQLAHC